MSRFSCRFVKPLWGVGLFAVILAGPASAQSDGRSGCSRDVARYCRAVMDNGDIAILSCLKQHRARLSKTCERVLAENGQ